MPWRHFCPAWGISSRGAGCEWLGLTPDSALGSLAGVIHFRCVYRASWVHQSSNWAMELLKIKLVPTGWGRGTVREVCHSPSWRNSVMENKTGLSHSIINAFLFVLRTVMVSLFLKNKNMKINKHLKTKQDIDWEFFSYVYMCAWEFPVCHGPTSFLNYIFPVVLRFVNRNIWTNYEGLELL